MNRLQTELQRLYAGPADTPGAPSGHGVLCRAFALELARPGDWAALSTLWKAVQTDLELPAPAIAINGHDGLQLWFSLSAPADAAQVQSWADRLCRRYLPEVPAHRWALLPGPWTAGRFPVPARQAAPTAEGDDAWSAFVAPDLAAVFADTPWLEMAPSIDGQAEILARLTSIRPEAWARACSALQPTETQPAQQDRETHAAAPAAVPPAAVEAAADIRAQAQRFLLSVMNDGDAPLAQRVEAAKALLADPVRRGA